MRFEAFPLVHRRTRGGNGPVAQYSSLPVSLGNASFNAGCPSRLHKDAFDWRNAKFLGQFQSCHLILIACGSAPASRSAWPLVSPVSEERQNSLSARSPSATSRIVAHSEATQVDGLSPYAANLCPLSRDLELAGFCEDFGESIGELIETMLGSAVRQRTAEHLDGVLGEQQRIDETVQTAACGEARGFRLRCEMARLRSGQMELSL